ncbi:unnamed protein product [Lactuca saligna]|uniref:Uncharacterized protein n=1 Tax=Lactuca saligna TaxID=75948 RepID=A0AA35Z926_LACSI|nr:unnamed protein product [Lactuca saligna]
MAMEQIEKNHEERLKLHVENFQYEVTKLRDVAKEHHVLFPEEVKKLEELVGSLKESLSKLDLSQQSVVSQDSISNMISSIESNLKDELSPLLKLVMLMPTSTQPVNQLVQGGDKGLAL